MVSCLYKLNIINNTKNLFLYFNKQTERAKHVNILETGTYGQLVSSYFIGKLTWRNQWLERSCSSANIVRTDWFMYYFCGRELCADVCVCVCVCVSVVDFVKLFRDQYGNMECGGHIIGLFLFWVSNFAFVIKLTLHPPGHRLLLIRYIETQKTNWFIFFFDTLVF